jgi:hypothetical protein
VLVALRSSTYHDLVRRTERLVGVRNADLAASCRIEAKALPHVSRRPSAIAGITRALGRSTEKCRCRAMKTHTKIQLARTAQF